MVEPKMPSSVEEVKNLSWDELNLVFAMCYATENRAVIDRGCAALREQVAARESDVRTTLATALAEVD